MRPAPVSFVARTLDHPAFAKLRPFEEISARTPIRDHCRALAEAGAPIAPESFAPDVPRRGVLTR